MASLLCFLCIVCMCVYSMCMNPLQARGEVIQSLSSTWYLNHTNHNKISGVK